MDDLTPEQRHKNMTNIKSINTKPEEIVRKYLFAQGLRYRKNVKTLPGRPDIVLPKYKTAIFINGCFWHRHEGCRYSVLPKSNPEYWIPKLERNQERDRRTHDELRCMGWKVLIVWECEIKKKADRETRLKEVVHEIQN